LTRVHKIGMNEANADRNAKIYARRSGGLTLAALSQEFQLSKETVREISRRMERKAKWRSAQLRGEEGARVTGRASISAARVQRPHGPSTRAIERLPREFALGPPCPLSGRSAFAEPASADGHGGLKPFQTKIVP
jgi:hypothetical protein